jgi:acyl-CoA synthetase (NDP forming)
MTHPLDALFRPRSVAVIGASSDPNKIGGRPLAFLKRAGYGGVIYPVNPSAASVQEIAAWPTLAAISGVVEQAIIALPGGAVLGAVEACVAKGVRALQIFSAGFGEGGAEGQRQQAQLRERAMAAGMRVLGPNSLGLFNTTDKFFGTFATALDGAWPRAGQVGVATQSGAFGSYFFGLAQARGLGFSHFVATGNECDVDVAECVEYMAGDAATRVIVMAIEGCKDGAKLMRALAAARAAGKPVVAMKVGVSQAGARAAATHTGSLAGEDRVFDAVLAEYGVYRAASLEEIVDVAYAASVAPLPRGKRLAIVTTSGGIGVLMADAAEARALELATISTAAAERIHALVPLAGGDNPVDTSAAIIGDLSLYSKTAAIMLEDRPYDAVLCFLAHLGRNPAHWAQLRSSLYALRRQHAALPFVAVLLADAELTRELEDAGFVVFADPTRAVNAIAGASRLGCAAVQVAAQAHAPQVIEGEPATEADAKQALSALGISFAPERRATSADAAVAAASALGFPVVMKILSPDIAHKTEVGGVALSLDSPEAVRVAYAAMRERVALRVPDARIEGVIVARQIEGGVEVLVGTHTDAIFGPVVSVGLGGTLTEILDDVALRLCPVDEAAARAMIDATRLGRLLRGYRGAPAADIAALTHAIVRLSEIAFDNRARVDGIDLNPVLARADGAFALDALIAFKGAPA